MAFSQSIKPKPADELQFHPTIFNIDIQAGRVDVLIECKNVYKSFGAKHILRGVNLKVISKPPVFLFFTFLFTLSLFSVCLFAHRLSTEKQSESLALLEKIELLELSLGSCPPILGMHGAQWSTAEIHPYGV